MILGLVFFAGSCASFRKQAAPTEKQFEVPKDLIDKFEVTDTVANPVAAIITPPQPAVKEVEVQKAGVVEKKDKGAGKIAKKEKKSKKKSEAKEQVKPEEPVSTAPANSAEDFAKSNAEKTRKNMESVEWPNRWPGGEPFLRVGERYVFDITFFGATAGELELLTLPFKLVAGRKSYHVQAHARTSSIFSLFYHLNDVAESYFDFDGIFSHKFSMKIDESHQDRKILELYDQKANKVYYWSDLKFDWKPRQLEQFEIPTEPYAQDGLSCFYYVRTLPLNVGDSFSFPMVNNGKMRIVAITVDRKEKLRTKIGEFNTIVLKPKVLLDGVIQVQGDNFIWISDDKDRILLKVDAKMKVGSLISYIREHSYEPESAPPKTNP